MDGQLYWVLGGVLGGKCHLKKTCDSLATTAEKILHWRGRKVRHGLVTTAQDIGIRSDIAETR